MAEQTLAHNSSMEVNQAPMIPKRSSGTRTLVWNTFITLLLGANSTILYGAGRMLLQHHGDIAVIKAQVSNDEARQDRTDNRIASIEAGGSTGLKEHAKQDDQRVWDMTKTLERHEATLATLTSTVAMIPGKLDTLAERLNSVEKSQARVEAALTKHMEQK